MSLQELMQAKGGFWDKEFAMVTDGQYARCVAVGTETDYRLTDYGQSLLGQVDYTSTSVVSSAKKRGRKPAAPVEVPLESLDDLDF